jgi:hypothetical protein
VTPTGRSSAPPATPPGTSLWQPEERILAGGDALSDYDVGWINLALDGPAAAETAVSSLHRLVDLAPRGLLPAHGPLPTDPAAALAHAIRRAQRLADDHQGAVWYGARRILAYALIIHKGIPTDDVETYLYQRPWVADAARLVDRELDEFTDELVDTMVRSGAILVTGRRLHAAADHVPVDPITLQIPLPRHWPDATIT